MTLLFGLLMIINFGNYDCINRESEIVVWIEQPKYCYATQPSQLTNVQQNNETKSVECDSVTQYTHTDTNTQQHHIKDEWKNNCISTLVWWCLCIWLVQIVKPVHLNHFANGINTWANVHMRLKFIYQNRNQWMIWFMLDNKHLSDSISHYQFSNVLSFYLSTIRLK